MPTQIVSFSDILEECWYFSQICPLLGKIQLLCFRSDFWFGMGLELRRGCSSRLGLEIKVIQTASYTGLFSSSSVCSEPLCMLSPSCLTSECTDLDTRQKPDRLPSDPDNWSSSKQTKNFSSCVLFSSSLIDGYLPRSLLFRLLICVYVSSSACVSVYHMGPVPSESRRWYPIPWNWSHRQL